MENKRGNNMEKPKELKIGDKAPDFQLINQDEKEISLSQYKGQWIILYFYPRDNTPGCTTEALDFSTELEVFKKLNAVVLGVSPDTVQSHCKFIEKHKLDLTLLSDLNKAVLSKFNVWQLKKMYGKEAMGVVRTTYLIDPAGKIAYIWTKVKVKDHVQEVKDKLMELQK